jgi:hypothetical protein
MLDAPYATDNHPALPPLMMNKSLRGLRAESSSNHEYGFQAGSEPIRDIGTKKEPPETGGLKVYNREASNRVDRSHSVSKRGQFQS